MPTSETTPSRLEGQSTTSVALKDDKELTVIAQNGDLILVVKHLPDPALPPTHASHAFLVASDCLRKRSVYFDRLLDPEGYAEGRAFAEGRAGTRTAGSPTDDLPRIKIEDLGPVGLVKSVKSLMTDFLHTLHPVSDMSPLAAQTATSSPKMHNVTVNLRPKSQKTEPKQPVQPSIGQIVRLCIVADRFEALHALRRDRKHKGFRLPLERRPPTKQPEERLRQRLLAHTLLQEDAESIRHLSLALILEGPTASPAPSNDGLWWHLPSGIEEEIALRRRCVLDTVQSIYQHFLTLYSSGRVQQCRLGYNTSPECDMYQFGQMTRFLQKIDAVRLTPTLVDREHEPRGASESDYEVAGDVNLFIDTLRACPAYQLDYHTHCGLRNRLLPALDLLQTWLSDVGVCLDCWTADKGAYSWTRAKIPLHVTPKPRKGGAISHVDKHGAFHDETRELFMARDRAWS